ncbi:MAG: translation initiation factor IF-3 [Thermoanaerobaculum sp.]
MADDRDRVRINEMIRLSPVRLIDADGTQVGIVPIEHALELARQRGLDLVEVAPTARPIVCKIMDWGKYRYEQEKKAREARKKEHQIEVKEVKFRPGVADHDFQTKLNMVRRFLSEGKHVKVTIMFRRREMRRLENGYEVLERVREALADVAKVEKDASMADGGRDLTMVFVPLRRGSS